jgi:hypothetical protein
MFYDAPPVPVDSELSPEALLNALRPSARIDGSAFSISFGFAQTVRGQVEPAGAGSRLVFRYRQTLWAALTLASSAVALAVVWFAPNQILPVLAAWLLLGYIIRATRRRFRFKTESQLAGILSRVLSPPETPPPPAAAPSRQTHPAPPG